MKRKTLLKEPASISYRSLCDESDKGCVIIIGSILDELLGQLHEAHIATSIYPSRKDIFGTLCNSFAPLSTFSGRIRLAYAYGLIDEGDYKDLELVRKLRNEAAHTLYDFNLQNAGAKSIISRLNALQRYQKLWDAEKARLYLSENKAPLPSMKNTQRVLIVNFLALQSILLTRIADSIEALLNRRRSN